MTSCRPGIRSVRGEFEQSVSVLSTTVVGSRDRCTVSEECGLYVVPDFSSPRQQFVCVETSGCNHIMRFDRTETYVKYNDKTLLLSQPHVPFRWKFK